MTSGPIRLNTAQFRAVRKLTKKCCNNVDGNCLLLDDGDYVPCVQALSYSLICRYFRNAVLPLDTALKDELLPVSYALTFHCKKCGMPFSPTSNRAKYCPDCRLKVHRENSLRAYHKRGQPLVR